MDRGQAAEKLILPVTGGRKLSRCQGGPRTSVPLRARHVRCRSGPRLPVGLSTPRLSWRVSERTEPSSTPLKESFQVDYREIRLPLIPKIWRLPYPKRPARGHHLEVRAG